ncbi:MAG: ABC transporter permease [Chitinophagaceae bacterium]|nr:ABC transporter permease [Chitinophagaceae bacterium]
MLKNYIKIAVRHFRKNKIFSLLNIIGLAIGMAACLLILQYTSFKLSYDQFHRNADQLYRVVNDRYQNGNLIQHGTITYSGVGKAMNDDFEEVIQNTRIVPGGEKIIFHNDKKISEEKTLYADNDFFSMFSFPLLTGNEISVLNDPYALILSEELIKKTFDYSGTDYDQFIGKSLRLSTDSMPYKIEGVFKNVPENSHLQFDLLISYKTLVSQGWKEADYDFTNSDFWHYVKLKPGADYQAIDARLPAFSKRHFQGNKISRSDETFYLQPLSKAHLYSDFEYEIGTTGNASVVWGLLLIALFIIVIAWVNYINLATARATERAKEVGIRKVVGGLKRQLINQFLIESAIVNFLGIALAFGLVFLIQPAFNNLLQHQLSLSYLLAKGLNGYSILFGLILIIVTGIFVSGFYPAFVLSSFKPITVLKGKISASKKGIQFRKMLVIGQFTATVALIIGSAVVTQQIRYMNKKELGFNMDQMLIIKPPVLTGWDSTFIDRTTSFKEELKSLPGVKGTTTSWRVPGVELGRTFNIRRAGAGDAEKFTMRHVGVDYEFMNVYGIKVLAGRNFISTDHNPDFGKLRNTIINHSAAKLLGFKSPDDAIGKSIMRGSRQWDVIGVVADYHQKSLHYPLEPILFMPAYSSNSSISVKVSAKDLAGTVYSLKQKYTAFFPGNLFDYYFLDEKFNRQYSNEQLFEKVFGIFTAFAIFVACLGLFGLTMFSTIQRTKEIGVRKVLGASVSNIIVLLSKDFIKLVGIACLIAFPISWWVMNNWLHDFSYRTPINGWVFLIAGGFALVIALVTISFQAIKAAVRNPVKSLRTE